MAALSSPSSKIQFAFSSLEGVPVKQKSRSGKKFAPEAAMPRTFFERTVETIWHHPTHDPNGVDASAELRLWLPWVVRTKPPTRSGVQLVGKNHPGSKNFIAVLFDSFGRLGLRMLARRSPGPLRRTARPSHARCSNSDWRSDRK